MAGKGEWSAGGWARGSPLERNRVLYRLTLAPDLDNFRGHWCLVNRKDLIGKIALDAELTRVQAARALNACLDGIQAGLVRGDRVTISGFGTFGVLHRKARTLRIPKTGKAVHIAAKRVPRFAAGTELKSAIQKTG
jgi:DNA-binding protein HU-beta